VQTKKVLPSLLALGLAGVVGAGCSSSSAVDGAKQVQQARSAALEKLSMAYTDVSQMPGSKVDASGANIVETLKASLSATKATQTLRFSNNQGNLDVILVNGVIYVRTDANTLVFALGMPASTGPSWAGHWLAISQSDPQFSEIAPTLTYESNLDPFLPTGTITVKEHQTLHGSEVTALTGSAAKTGTVVSGRTTLYVSADTGLPLGATVQAVDKDKHAITEVVQFTSFGDPVVAVAPSDATPFSTALHSSAP
jgi:hypothetical protein